MRVYGMRNQTNKKDRKARDRKNIFSFIYLYVEISLLDDTRIKQA